MTPEPIQTMLVSIPWRTLCVLVMLASLAAYMIALGVVYLWRKKASKAPPDLRDLHPATGRYCHVCGAERDVEPCSRAQHLDDMNQGRYCHICKADALMGEPCDAGLHS